LSYYTVLSAIAEGRLTPIRTIRSDLPVSFEAALSRALQKEPDRRYRSVHEFGAALWDFASDQGRIEYAAFKRAPVDLTKLSNVELPIQRSVSRAPAAIAGGTQKLPSATTAGSVNRPSAAAEARPSSGTAGWPRYRNMVIMSCAAFAIAATTTWVVVDRRHAGGGNALHTGAIVPGRRVASRPAPPVLPAPSPTPPSPTDVPAVSPRTLATPAVEPRGRVKTRKRRSMVVNTRSGEEIVLPSAR
jgi:hypothetical protein